MEISHRTRVKEALHARKLTYEAPRASASRVLLCLEAIPGSSKQDLRRSRVVLDLAAFLALAMRAPSK